MSNLSKIEGTPIDKLLDVVNKTIGIINLPLLHLSIGGDNTNLSRISAIKGAKTEALLTNNDERYAELTAIEKRVIVKESKRQNNINNVVAIAAQSLNEGQNVSPEPVDQDWATRFFDIAQDISDEAMQNLWGRILAGETTYPGSYSLRTLETLRNITTQEAQLFEDIAKYVLTHGVEMIFNGFHEELEKFGIKYYNIAKLIEAGLIQSESMAVQHFYLENGQSTCQYILYGDFLMRIEQPVSVEDISLPVYVLSTTGHEILKLIKATPNIDYLALIAKYIKKNNKDIKISYTKILSKKPNGEVEVNDESFMYL